MCKTRRWCLVLVVGAVWQQSAGALDPDPLPFPLYVACRIHEPIVIDGTLEEPAWRRTSLGWGLSHAHEPNVLCPDPTLFRIGWDDRALWVSLACIRRPVQDDLPEHVWRPRESALMDTQAIPRHARERGVVPPVNTADLLVSHGGRTLTVRLAPPQAPVFSVHDALGERPLDATAAFAYGGDPTSALWTAELRAEWQTLGFSVPAVGDDWALNVYRDIRFFSNWAFIAWMRDWDKITYSRYDVTDRFGRVLFADEPDRSSIETVTLRHVSERGPVRVFLPDALWVAGTDGRIARQYYAERVQQVRGYAEHLLRERQRIGNDLPYHPFFTEKEPRPHLEPANQRINGLRDALSDPPVWDDPASVVARIEHALPEAREGLAVYAMERLYRGLPE